MTTSPNVTRMLKQWSDGDRDALDALVSVVYDELHRMARHYLGHERPDHTLQATALVNEAYLKLVDAQHADWRDRVHFFAVAARIMHHILVDHARTHVAEKRGGHAVKVPVEEGRLMSPRESAEVLALHDALEDLARVDEQQARIVELRYFGGLSIEETATALGISPRTVNREWSLARAWLKCAILESVDAARGPAEDERNAPGSPYETPTG